ncbi:GNAT family N-acetyltransferase [Paludicola sp. MB14-C6]|uniref:GNAT family N-acetyltransferase n=1 Tax=Paludihabitans sp. MB14-C6 TaxID=3070656 RepID=UPI0027DC6300|nr:GNAT family N-acetyltransferase [Paludicola sp. MB14-C6]WMJ22555.1 GNAT family N-acetyltransferase [Paludicola sp. MB14-C6]
MEIQLVKPIPQHETAYWDFIKEWNEKGEKIIPAAVKPIGNSYQDWLTQTEKFEKKETCPSQFVPAYTYFLMDNNHKILGAINIRLELNEMLLNYGGNIGYGIAPSERRKGYASTMLALSLPIAKELGLEKVLVCCNKENIGSAKTIQKNNGILEDERANENEITQRYWITL